jgi:precorrin-6B methylase 1
MSTDDERVLSPTGVRGRLTIIGTGIMALAHMSPQALSYIEQADIVFYHATNGVTADQIRQHSRESVDLYEYYDEGKRRKITYVQMAELMLREVRKGRRVVGAFHGHPGFFVFPARRALAIASAEGYETAMIPAISAPDCMFADLRVDPGRFGCQTLMANRVFSADSIIATTGHVVFLQVSAVGDKGFSYSGYKHNKLDLFFERLIEIYGEEQDAVYYMAAVFPGLQPEIMVRQLKAYRDAEVQGTVRAGMLYLPPKGLSFSSLIAAQAFNKDTAYGPFEMNAIADLEHRQTPAGFTPRMASRALRAAMTELTTNADSLEEYKKSPDEFADRFPGLSPQEREALCSRYPGALRRLTVGGGPGF